MPTEENFCAYSAIKALITSGEIPAGAPLSQLDLTRRFGISRTPVREALRRLQAEGLVDAEHHKRMRVSSLTPDDLDTIYAMRVLLESMGVALSVPQMTRGDLDELQTFSAAINWEYDRSDSDERDRQLLDFKLRAMKYAGSGVQAEVSTLFGRCERVRKMYSVVSPGSLIVAHEEHLALLKAFIDADVDRAVFVASRHLARTALAVIGYMAPDYEPRALRYSLNMTSTPISSNGALPIVNVIGSGPRNVPAGREEARARRAKTKKSQGEA
ncbi:GntR family transcriptional regulator [Amorphus sp. MBR-141]